MCFLMNMLVFFELGKSDLLYYYLVVILECCYYENVKHYLINW